MPTPDQKPEIPVVPPMLPLKPEVEELPLPARPEIVPEREQIPQRPVELPVPEAHLYIHLR